MSGAPASYERLRLAGRIDQSLTTLDDALERIESGVIAGLVLVIEDTEPRPAEAISSAFSDICERLARSPAPVIAVLGGKVQGLGAALALAAQARIATAGAALVWPEITVSLLPPAGAMVRLARLVGAGLALDLMGSARAIAGDEALAAGLVDAVTSHEDEAVALAGRLIAAGLPERQQPDPAAAMAAVQAARLALESTNTAPLAPARLIDSVEAAFLLPVTAAFAYAQEADADVLADPTGHALRYLAQAERSLSAELIRRDAQNVLTLSQAGMEAAGALRAAWVIAARALIARGDDPLAIDAAALAFGHAEGPLGAAPPPREDAQIAARLQGALVAEAARLIAAGRLGNGRDADALAVMATGFPRWRGGPVFMSLASGQILLLRQLQDWAQDDPVWTLPEDVGREILLSGQWTGWGPV